MTTNFSSQTASDEEVLALSWPRAVSLVSLHIVVLFAPCFFSWRALGVAIFMHWLCGSVGICLGYHRVLTHRSLQLPQWLEYIVVTIGALAFQGGPLFWVSNHRMHHAFTEDNERDPHSANRGFLWSHMLWLVYPRGETFDGEAHRRRAPKLARNPYYCWLDRNYPLLQVPLGFLLYSLGGWSFVMYGIFVRIIVLWHSTWFVNSATHIQGYRPFNTSDGSRNLWWVGLLTYGEGWHNNHHAEPNVAAAGRRWWEVDMTWWLILVLERCNLAHHIKRPAIKPSVATAN